MAFLRLESINGQHHRLHIRIRGSQLVWSLGAGRQHLLVAVNVRLDSVIGQANLVRVGQFGTDLPDRPVAGKASLAQPTYHIPTEHPPRHRERGLRFGTHGPRVSRAHTLGAMGEFTDDVDGPVQGQQTTMAMITYGQGAAARSAPPILDFQGDTGKGGVLRPAVWHGRPLLAKDADDDNHTRYRA